MLCYCPFLWLVWIWIIVGSFPICYLKKLWLIGHFQMALGLEIMTTTMTMMIVRVVRGYLELKSQSIERKNSRKKVLYVYSCRNMDQAYRISVCFIHRSYLIILIHVFLFTKFCYFMVIAGNWSRYHLFVLIRPRFCYDPVIAGNWYWFFY